MVLSSSGVTSAVSSRFPELRVVVVSSASVERVCSSSVAFSSISASLLATRVEVFAAVFLFTEPFERADFVFTGLEDPLPFLLDPLDGADEAARPFARLVAGFLGMAVDLPAVD